MNKLIQWPRAKYWDKAWNPVIGCRPVSPACENCWAREWAGRFGQSFGPHEIAAKTPPRKGVVFCGNLTDLWGEWNLVHEFGGYLHKSCDWIAETLDHNPDNPYKDKAVYLWLTKRADTMAEWVSDGGWDTSVVDCDDCVDFRDCDMSNHYFGFTAEDQSRYAERLLPIYRGREDWMRCWVSCEPLLGPINLRLKSELIRGNFSWVVVGCESGPRRRPCKVEWVESIVDQCVDYGIPVFVKQLDIGGRCVTDIEKFPEHLRVRQVPWKVER